MAISGSWLKVSCGEKVIVEVEGANGGSNTTIVKDVRLSNPFDPTNSSTTNLQSLVTMTSVAAFAIKEASWL